MKNFVKESLTIFAILLFAVIACRDTRREPDKSEASENDTVKNYNPPAHIIKGPDTMGSTDTVKKDTGSYR